MAKLKSSPGGVEGKTSEENTFYSREQIEKMSIEEIRKNMAKVDASLAYLRKKNEKERNDDKWHMKHLYHE